MKICKYYEEAGIVIWHGDCRDVLPLIGPVDHVITDPPYGDVTHKGARTQSGTEQAQKLVDFASITADALRVILEACQIGRWLVSFMEWRHIAALEAAPPTGLRFVRFGIWVKPNGAPQFTGDRPSTGWEGIAFMHKDGPPLRWNGGGTSSVYTCFKTNGSHPTQKPASLVAELISDFTDPGELILDPFMGSGTTLVAAKQLGRRAIGIELEEKYCQIAVERLRNTQPPLVITEPEPNNQLTLA